MEKVEARSFRLCRGLKTLGLTTNHDNLKAEVDATEATPRPNPVRRSEDLLESPSGSPLCGHALSRDLTELQPFFLRFVFATASEGGDPLADAETQLESAGYVADRSFRCTRLWYRL